MVLRRHCPADSYQATRDGDALFLLQHTKARGRQADRGAGNGEGSSLHGGLCGGGLSGNGEGLTQLIQTQEKLADIFGRKRRTVSIGLYRLAPIVFPVSYDLVKPDEVRFTPLGMETMMTLREILMVHPKGVEYGGDCRRP